MSLKHKFIVGTIQKCISNELCSHKFHAIPHQYYAIQKLLIHRLSHDKQKNVNAIRNETKHHIWQQRDSPYYKEYINCQNSDEILNVLTKYEDRSDIIIHYIWAIQRLANLEQFKLCWKIFNDITTTHKYIPLLNTQLYTTMIWLSCHQHMSQPDKIRNDTLRRKKTCDKIFSILAALKTKVNLKVDNDVITTLISSCTKLQQFGRGEGFWKSLHSDKNGIFEDIELNIECYNAMLDLYSKSDQMNEAYDLYESIKINENVQCDNCTFAILINGCHKHGDMQTAEKIFQESQKYFMDKNGNKPTNDVYCALMNGYASRGNVLQCWDLFTEIMESYEQNKNVIGYEPDIMIFSVMLKSLARLNNNEKLRKKRARNVKKFIEISIEDGDKLSVDDCWKMIKYIILKMKELNIKRNVVIYGLLFHLCGDAFGETNCKYNVAEKFYHQMIQDKIEISSLCFHNLLRAGLCHYNVIEQDLEKREKFVKWILTEMKKHNVPISSQTRLTLRHNNIDIVDHRDHTEQSLVI